MGDVFDGGLPDPLNVHKSKDRGGMGLPDPLNLFDSMPAVPEAPKVALDELPTELKTPAVMPTQNSQEARAAKRRSIAAQAARRGRLSTVLSNDDGLGG